MSVDHYRVMLSQRRRVEAFRARVHEAVRAGDRVLEIGAGLGTYAFFAAEAGAARVVAVESGPVIQVAREIARHNGLADRVEFVHGWFPGVEVPDAVDVLIFENYPPRLFDEWTFHVLRKAHALLAPGGRLIPDRARVYLAPVETPRTWAHVGALGGDTDSAYGLDWTPSRAYVYNAPLDATIARDALRHEPARVAELDLRRLPTAADLSFRAEWTFDAPTTIHGLVYWFDLEVGAGVWLTNRPGRDPGAWGYLYLPVAAPFRLAVGETLAATVSSEPSPTGAPRWLRWDIATPSEHFHGHEFRSVPASRAEILEGASAWVPALSRRGWLEGQILALADGRHSVEEIARAVLASDGVPTLEAAEELVLTTLEGRTAEKVQRGDEAHGRSITT